ncbi:MAG: C25 family cysteine peptidase [Candidatus Omnitrophota bacterium]
MKRKLIASLNILLIIGLIFSFSTKVQSAVSESVTTDATQTEPALEPTNLISEQYTIPIPEPIIRELGSKIYYEIKDFGSNVVLGLPLLPHKKFYFEIPFNAKDVNVAITATGSRSLGIVPNIAVFQGVASGNNPGPDEAKILAVRNKYLSVRQIFPEDTFKVLGGRSIKGHRLICVAINPLSANLLTNEVTFNSSFTVKIQYSLDETQAAAQTSIEKSPVFEKTAKEIIYNYPEEQTLESITATQTVTLAPIADVPIQYAIITLAENVSAVQPLADWKTKKGIPAKVYTTTEIETAHPEGADLQEKIRLFITNPSPNPPNNPFYSAKFDWLLFAGEQGGGMPDLTPTEGIKLPSRYVGPVTWHTDDNDIVPADYYYADCAGGSVADSYRYDWDTGGSAGVYGELADDIRWIPDTYVGRIPSNESAKLSAVVNKIIAYEKNPTAGTWTKETVLNGAKINDTGDHSAIIMDAIKANLLDPAGLTTYRLYYDQLNKGGDAELTEANFISYVSPGRSLVEWFSHGNNIRAYYSVPLPDKSNYFLKGDITSINNANKRSVIYVAACDNGKFDFHNSGQTVNSYFTVGDSALFGYGTLHDWAIAFMAAARTVYYWIGISPNPETQGVAQGEQYRFNQQVFSYGKYNIGQAFNDMKLDIVNDFDGNPTFDPDSVLVARKNLFAMNLLGDPEMEIWTDIPQQFNVTYPSQVYNTPHEHTITVTDGTNPVQGARVTLYKSADAFGTGLTDVNGEIIFTISTATAGNMDLTVTKHNFVPAERTILVVNERFLTISSSSGGTTNPAPGNYSYVEGTPVSVSATPNNQYYLFDHWELDGAPAGSTNPISITMNVDHTLNAVFTQINYDLNITTTWCGTTDPEPGTHSYGGGSTVNVNSNPCYGYKLDHWELDGQNIGIPFTYNQFGNWYLAVLMDGPHSVNAVYVKKPPGGTGCSKLKPCDRDDLPDPVY